MKNKLFLFILAIAFLGTAIQVQALPWTYGSNIVIDLSAEYLLNKVVDPNLIGGSAPADSMYFDTATGTYYTTDNGDTTLDEGDRLRSIFRIHEIQNSDGAHFLPDTGMFAGLSEIEVTEITDTGTPSLKNYSFGVSSDFSSQYTTAGTMVAMYLNDAANPFVWENGGVDAPGVADEEALVSNVTAADLYWTFGFSGVNETADGGEGWESINSPSDISVFSLMNTTTQAGSAYFGLSLLDNLLGPDIFSDSVAQTPIPGFVPVLGDGSDVDLYGSAGLFGIIRSGAINTPFDATDSLRGELNLSVVPEPSTLLLCGIGLLGMAGIGRRKILMKK